MSNVKIDLKDKKSVLKIAIVAVAFFLLVFLAGSFIKNAADISRLNSQLEEAESKYNQQIEENSSLKAILESDDKNSYIEDKAREEGYVKDGEVIIYDVD